MRHHVAKLSSTISPFWRQTIFASREYAVGSKKSELFVRERRMGVVMIKCPATGREIPTGMVADRRSFNAAPVFFARVQCPICIREHEWFAKDAWVHEPEAHEPEPEAAPEFAA